LGQPNGQGTARDGGIHSCGMSRRVIERRLTEVHRRLLRAREELAVIDEQFAALADAANESEYRDAQRHADAMARSRAVVLQSISELEKAQDDLLDKLEVN